MRTERQQQTSRENGAKSHGPATSEGKAASARNATKHGLTARNPILLTVEDQQAFQQVRDEYEQLFQPANVVERQLIDEMVSIQWRRQRAEALEASTLDFAIDRMANDVAARFTEIDNTTRVALAFNHEVNESKTLHNLQRISLQLSRQYLRLLKAFQNLRANPTPAPKPPEPEARAQPESEIRKNEPESAAKVIPFPPPPAPTEQNEQNEPEPTEPIDGLPHN